MSGSHCCLSCGCPLPAESTVCPICGEVDKVASRPLPTRNPWSFSLAELLLGTTYVCILLGVTLTIPEWGIFLWIISAIAFVRTVWFSVAWKRAGRPYTPLAQIGSFAGSLLVMTLISAAACVAFFGVCLPLGVTVVQCCSPSHSEFLAACAWVFGGAAGLASGGYLLWKLCLWPIVIWWRVGQPPALLERLAVLGKSLVILTSTMLGSALFALAWGWIWMVSFGSKLEDRNERVSRIVLYFVLLAGYIVGLALGIIAGRSLAAYVRLWFWPVVAIALVAVAVLTLLASGLMRRYTDDSGISATMVGILLALIVGLAIHRWLELHNENAPSKKE